MFGTRRSWSSLSLSCRFMRFMLISVPLPIHRIHLPHVLQSHIRTPLGNCPDDSNMPGLLVLASRFRRRSGVFLVSGRLGIRQESVYIEHSTCQWHRSLFLVLHHTSSHSLCFFSLFLLTFLSEPLLRDSIISSFFRSFLSCTYTVFFAFSGFIPLALEA